MPDRVEMTPGPTIVPEAVRRRMAEPTPNPDMDPAFLPFYRELMERLATLFDTDHDVVVLGGEGILGLEASIASLIEPGDPVLCISNGLYGDGFADFVELYGGEPTLCGGPDDRPIDVDRVEEHLASDTFVAATMVHCETPTGVLNDLEPVLERCSDAGVLTIVDAVSSVGGTPVPVDDIDVCIAGSQKCLSSPPGLTMLAVSEAAWSRVEAVPQRSFYTSLAPWRDAPGPGDLLPYTHLVANLQALEASVEAVLDEGLESVFERHRRVAERCRERIRTMGLDVHPIDDSLASPTVTAVRVDRDASELQRRLLDDHDVLVATGLDEHATDLLRIGHMGANAHDEPLERTLDALAAVLEDA